jgi:hypothetical protein
MTVPRMRGIHGRLWRKKSVFKHDFRYAVNPVSIALQTQATPYKLLRNSPSCTMSVNIVAVELQLLQQIVASWHRSFGSVDFL